MAAKRACAVLLLVAAALCGCGLTRDEIKLSPEPPSIKAAPSKGKTVFVRSVTDERVFSTGNDPATPSLASDEDKLDYKARAVMRKGASVALGDVLLEPGQTVAGQVGDALRQAFQLAGFTVLKEAGGGAAPIIVDVRVKRFWSWAKKGFTAITEVTDIDTELSFTGVKSGPDRIVVHAEADSFVSTPPVRIDALQKAIAAYRTEAVTKLADLKF